ncbi:helix-turn-helix transcriptional regulator [Kineosporia sp. NBRC 101731]|uniref:helix-turn-helix domain-containing protein n=1 Tax=Kineosporia sp. NBRC 101731 TaxID=3032199 RepID=UPI0024A5338C|nr:helix-turn-helix transcriptional regulator [Kineosporia sp. NBRC 101731]GLY31585.1 transcriptional regulator [Kineosporia sp. NBRC 101731]
MQTEITGSTVPRRQLGRYMRDLRGQARMTVRAVAKELEWSEGKIWRIETGKSSMRSHDAELMCQIYGASSEMTSVLSALAGETKARGWWHSYGDVLPKYFDVYIGLEEGASAFRWYETDLVPGLLQTESYARTLVEEAHADANEAEIDHRVRVRIGRGALLTRATAPPTFQAVISESILRRPVGGAEVMAAQLDHLVQLSGLDHVQLRVLPFRVGYHAGIHSGPFITLRFPVTTDGRESEPPTIYVESLTGALYLDKPAELLQYDAAWQGIWGSSLGASASVNLMRQAAKEFRS